jgi:hypothetical protein
MGTAAGMIAQARKLLGTREQPMGSNHAPPVTTWYGLGDVAWCDESISYEAAHSDSLPVMGGKFAYTVAHAQWFKSKGRWHVGLTGVKPGDVVFYDWAGTRSIGAIDHVGLVERVLADGTIYSLEGNTSDVFARRHRDGKYVAGYGRPAYSSSQEDDVSAKDVWNQDGIIPSPPWIAEKGNKFWTASSYLQWLYRNQAKQTEQLAAQNAAIGELTKTVAALAANPSAIDVDALVGRINDAISNVVVRLDTGAEGT